MNTDKVYAEQLANEYAPKDTSKVVALRKLDARAKLPATVFTYTLGVAAALVLGVGALGYQIWDMNRSPSYPTNGTVPQGARFAADKVKAG